MMPDSFALFKEGFNPRGSIAPLTTLRTKQRNLTPEDEAEAYWMPSGLSTAINVALHTGMPLLLTGDPGAGKTMAAFAIAHRFALPDVLRFQVRSDSRAQDLRYRYDAVGHFRAVQIYRKDDNETAPDVWDFIEPGRLWRAIAPPDRGRLSWKDDGKPFPPRLLLIDEIDKAPRDFPNDLLDELERLQFDVPEAPRDGDVMVRIRIEGRPRPIIVITSNAERRLPEPFLRRCVYHHIKLDDLDREALARAVKAHLGEEIVTRLGDGTIGKVATLYTQLAQNPGIRKKPSLPEIRSWLTALAAAGDNALEAARTALDKKPIDVRALPLTGALFKSYEDLSAFS